MASQGQPSTDRPEPSEGLEFVPFSDLESRRQLWSTLAERSRNIFASFEWAEVWWRHFGAEAEPAFVECIRDGTPIAILPLYVSRHGPLKLLRLLGHGPGDVLGPVCAPDDAPQAMAALRRALSEARGPRILLAERLPGSNAQVLGGRRLLHEANPTLDTDNLDWDGYLRTCSRNLREKLRRNTRKLERDHTVRFRLCESESTLSDDLDTLFRLHSLRWGDRGAFGQAETEFHRELAGTLLRLGRLRLWTMDIDGDPAASWYGFRFAGVEAYYQSGRDPRFDRFSIGFLMLARTLRAAFDDGLDRYAFLRGDEPYKARFATADSGLETIALGDGGGASAAVRLGATAIKAPWLRHSATRFIQ